MDTTSDPVLAGVQKQMDWYDGAAIRAAGAIAD
jgi:hypothetical protein